MNTLNAAVWLLIKEKAESQTVFDKYVTVYRDYDRDKYAWLLLYFAAQAGHSEVVERLLATEDVYKLLGIPESTPIPISETDYATTLIEVVRKGNVHLVEVMLAKHPHLVSVNGSVFVQNPHVRAFQSPLEYAIQLDSLEVVKVLLRHYSGEVFGNAKRHALHFACKNRSPNCLAYMLEQPEIAAQVNLADSDGWTPLLLAAGYQPRVIPLLLEKGADIFAKHDGLNALQMLCNGCIIGNTVQAGETDPIPNVSSNTTRPRGLFAASETLYIAPNIVQLAQMMVDRGLDVNGTGSPLKMFCNNIKRQVQELLGNERNIQLYKEVIDYLASVSNRDILNSSLMLLCHQMMFLCSQLRRSGDYDNIVRHVNVMSLVKDCIFIILDHGADPNTSEPADEGEKRLRGLQYLIPFSLPYASQLKHLVTEDCQKPYNSETVRNSPVDIVLITAAIISPLQLEEPEMHLSGLNTVFETFKGLSRMGSKCRQDLQFFLSLCVDPANHIKFLKIYLDCQSQSEYHMLVEKLLSYSDDPVFAQIEKQISSSRVRLFSLKDLLRRDIIQFLGSQKCPDKVESLPLPTALKTYLLAFWEVTSAET